MSGDVTSFVNSPTILDFQTDHMGIKALHGGSAQY